MVLSAGSSGDCMMLKKRGASSKRHWRAPVEEYCAIISDEEQWPLLPGKVSSSPAAPEQPMVVVLSFR
jgi:hypothetical protein